ncbi:MAG: GrpB family protein [bacterium]|nr:GrpB family protein [bacterium]
MLTKDEKDSLSKIPKNKKVKIITYNTEVTRMAKKIIVSIKTVYPNINIEHMGASALKISGQNDIDIYAFSDSSDFDEYLLGLIRLFGKPLHKHKTFIEWKFKKNNFDIELYLTDKNSETMKRQITVFEQLKNDKDLLREYEILKESMNNKPFRDYQKKKYEFYHRVLKQYGH